MAIVLPNLLTAKTRARASQVMENFNALVSAVEGVSGAASGADVYQTGVVAYTDWITAAKTTVNSATGALTFASLGGAAWLPGPSGPLVRTFSASATIGPLVPPALPGVSGYRAIGVDLAASGASALVGLSVGTEQASEAEALAHPASIPANKARIADVILHNTAGVYSIAVIADRRLYATGRNNLPLRLLTGSGIFSLNKGETVSMATAGQKGRLPAPERDAMVRIFALATVELLTLGGGGIYGGSLNGVTTLTLAARQSVTLLGDSENWLIVAAVNASVI